MIERLDLILKLNRLLLAEMPQYRQEAGSSSAELPAQRRLLRSLMNVRPPMPLSFAYLALQDELLAAEREERGIVDVMALPTTADPRIVLWQGDITRLNADAIVNAANSALLGCFYPCHGCIDNAIHSAAGLQVRDECHRLMLAQGHEEPVGQAKITGAYNLPSSFILHTVGPMIRGPLTKADCDLLAGCYRSCLEQTANLGLQSVAFCCISTGEFRFPNEQAAEIAVETVRGFLAANKTIQRVIFDVFTARDRALYQELLSTTRQYMSRLPIPDAPAAEREAIGGLATQITAQAQARYALHRQARHRILTDLGAAGKGGAGRGGVTPPLQGTSLNQKLTAWWELDFSVLRDEIRKVFRQEIPLKERDAWEAWLAEQRDRHEQLTAAIVGLETDLNRRVYALFDLSGAEIKLIEASTKYRYGEV